MTALKDLYLIDRVGALTPLASPDDFRAAEHGLAVLTADTSGLLARAWREHPAPGSAFALTLLVPPRPAPEAACHRERITTFLATGDWVRALLDAHDGSAAELCYRALACVLNAPAPAASLRIVDRALPGDTPPTSAQHPTIDVVVPHRGDTAHLCGALDSLSGQTLPARTILCFDQTPEPALVRRLLRRAGLALHQVVPDPAGPYVPRQHVALTSTARYVAFQDSDDVSMPARLATLVACAESCSADVVGSHELRCDEINRTVAAVRYPLDVNRALDLGDGSVQLFPATLVRRTTVQRLGGFSTKRTYAADRQFQVRAYGSARIVNVDAFLYVRRRRAGSLSTSIETGMQSAERRRINLLWDASLQRVRGGAPVDGEPALALEHSSSDFTIRDLRTGHAEPARLRSVSPDHDPKDRSHSDTDPY